MLSCIPYCVNSQTSKTNPLALQTMCRVISGLSGETHVHLALYLHDLMFNMSSTEIVIDMAIIV